MHVLVVGGGVAGTTCAEAVVAHAKLRNFKLHVTVLSADSSVCVGYALVSSARAKEVHVHCIRGNEWSKSEELRFKRSAAVELDTRRQIVKLEDGSELQYHVLCIATGAAPLIPSPLMKLGNRVHVLRDVTTFRRLEKAVASARDVVIVGNGGVALETVHAFKEVNVKWLFRNDHAGAAFFDSRSIEALIPNSSRTSESEVQQIELPKRVLETAMTVVKNDTDKAIHGASHGPFWRELGCLRGTLGVEGTMERRGGVEVVEASMKLDEESEDRIELVLSSGERVMCDLILCGTGVAPCVKWLDGSGLEFSAGPSGANGISVEAGSGRSSVPNVFAVGDCATVHNAIGADWFQRYLWTQARAAGVATGRAIVAQLTSEKNEPGMEFELFTHATRFFGVPVVFLGRYAAQGLEEGYKMIEDRSGNNFVRVVLHNGRVRGALLVGEESAARSETYENLILDALYVEHLGSALASLDTDIEDYFD